MSQTKVCTGCLTPKSTGDFYRNRGGLHSLCKACYVERNKGYQKKYRDKNRFAIRMRSARHRASDKGLPFDLDVAHLKGIWTGVCPVFGTPLSLKAPKGSSEAAELDRVVPEKGYVKGNVQWLSQRANRIKDDASIEDLERIIEWLKSRLTT